MKKITVLYTRKKSIYNELGCDTWDIERDARNYEGRDQIIAHPPCRGWGNYRHKAKVREGEKELARSAIRLVRENGGVVEHPRRSKLWEEMKLPIGRERDEYGGWTLDIDQAWFGHRAEKRTRLYIVGVEPKDIPGYRAGFRTPSRTVEMMGRAERESTPRELAEWLIKVAEACQR